MGCSIKPQYQQIPKPAIQNSQIIVQLGNFVKENKNDFQSIYRIGKLLGTGRFGEVRICNHRTSGLKRAVKIIRKDLLTSAQDRESLDKEINILKSLDHPNIIRVYEFFEEVKRLYIVMEYCAGGELFSQIVKNKHFSESHASNIMKQIFLTLEYLQTQGIVHKDLKPENILLEDKTTAISIKIIDFGAAEINRSQAMIKGNVGTVYYISPEILQGKFSVLTDM